MQCDLGSRDFDLRPNFDIDLLRSPSVCFDASRRDKHDGTEIKYVAL